jgi:hypothetical protein
VIVTIDVVRTRGPGGPLAAYRVWREAKRAWDRGPGSSMPGRTVVGAQYTFRGERVHAPWGPKPRVLPNVLRADGWGWIPTLMRVMILTRWEDEGALRAFEATDPWPRGAEHWHARLRPVKVKGEIEGEQHLGDFLAARGTDDEPGVMITWNKMRIWRLPAFRLWVRRIADDQQVAPGSLASFNAADMLRPFWFKAFTISCWEHLGDAVAWAYKREPHKSVIKWYGNPHRFGEPWWGRFVVEESRGTLAGRDPFEGIELSPAPAPVAAPAPAVEAAAS